MQEPLRILFVCTGNSARSQMAEAFARVLGRGSVESFSGGTDPETIQPLAIETMAELGVDISGQRSKSLETFRGQRFDLVISLCERANETCASFPATEQLRWSFDDPAAAEGTLIQRRHAFWAVATQIKRRVEMMLAVYRRKP
jgi:protein-tyrosine-phosphatase